MKDNHIIHILGNVDDKRMTSPIERFNGTLRLSMEKYKMTYGRISKNVLPTIIDAYNHSVHNVGYSPIDILNSEKYQNIIKQKYIKSSKKYNNRDILTGHCRILLHKPLFAKMGANWSTEIYKIKNYNTNNNRYSLEGVDGEFSRDELQPIDKDNLMKSRVRLEE